jgi:hypothetical protein
LFTSNCPAFAKKTVVGMPDEQFPSPRSSNFGKLKYSDELHKYKRSTMRLALINEVRSTNKPQKKEQAQVRILIVALVSFFLGVAATAFWFHLASNRTAESLSSQASSEGNQQDNQPSAVPSSGANSPARTFVEQPVPVAPAAIEDVKRVLPNYASISVDEGTEILRQAALKEFAAAAQELQSQVAQAQAQLSQAESKSPADQQVAMKHLQQVQAEQSQKLQQIAGQLSTQIAALKQLKNAK